MLHQNWSAERLWLLHCGVHTTNLLYFLYAGSNLFMLYLFYNGLQRTVFKQNLKII